MIILEHGVILNIIPDNRRCARAGAATVPTDAPDGAVSERQFPAAHTSGHKPAGEPSHAGHVKQQAESSARGVRRPHTAQVRILAKVCGNSKTLEFMLFWGQF